MTTWFHTSCVWLDWIDRWNFTLVYGLFHIWYSHTTHKTLFRQCLSHLCDCTCSNVMCMLKYLLIKPKNFFKYFICFWKWFYTYVLLVFVQNAFLCFSSKTGSEVFSREARKLRASHEMCLREIKKSPFHTESLTTTSWVFRD